MKTHTHVILISGLMAISSAFSGLPASSYSKLLDQVRAREGKMEVSLRPDAPLPLSAYSKLLDKAEAKRMAAIRSSETSSSGVSLICTHSKLLDHVRHMEQIRQMLAKNE